MSQWTRARVKQWTWRENQALSRKVFGFVSGMAFTFGPESRSPLGRNTVRLPTGIAFGIGRIYQFMSLIHLRELCGTNSVTICHRFNSTHKNWRTLPTE